MLSSNWVPLKILLFTLANYSISDDHDYEIDDRLLPVVYRNILPSNKRAEPIGRSLTLKCFVAADDKIVYKWFKNGSVSSLSTFYNMSYYNGFFYFWDVQL